MSSRGVQRVQRDALLPRAVIIAAGRIACAGAVLALTGCAVLQPAPDRGDLARETARAAVAPVLMEKAPGVPLERAVDCTLEYASRGQIEALAQNAALGQPGLNDDIVTDILYTQGTRDCMRGGPIYEVLNFQLFP